MRRLSFTLPLLASLIVFLPACKRQPKPQAAKAEPEAALLSVVNVNDPAGTVQLAAGFFELEANSWRWTGPKFTAVLGPPEGAPEKGARLELHLTLPAVVVDKIGPVSLSAEIGGTMLAPERYTQTGDYVYARDVDAGLLKGGPVTIHFSTDKFLPPAGAESRQLCLIVTSVGLVPK